ncbi:hypothetical protein Goshw_018696 [Gossypium schwendimanii]|uniref:Uncharacterized protein n=1 Tax=Gossypium schwendimanii TaxID=34291 RepID=A0A7J9L4R4_GOSSC|nr:hypothetical protein [Gossypium schwendimanii]
MTNESHLYYRVVACPLGNDGDGDDDEFRQINIVKHNRLLGKPLWLIFHKEAGQFRHCSFPYYDQLTSIYAKDRATRKYAQTAVDIIEDIDVEDITPAKNPKKGSNDHGCKVYVSLDEMDVLATQLHPSKPN